MQESKMSAKIVTLMLLLVIGLLLNACGPINKSTESKTGASKLKGSFNLKTAIQSADTVRIRQFLAGNWNLDKTCLSSFAGLKCDTSVHQTWQLDSLGGIGWLTEGGNAVTDKFHFVAREGVRAGMSKGDTSWVMYLDQARRGYLLQTLTKDTLKISDYPLIMDKTTTYTLSR